MPVGGPKMNEVLKTAQMNHDFLVKKLESKQGARLTGKWIAVARRKICVSASITGALRAMKSTEPDRSRILLAHIPSQRHRSLAF